jgi:hypothetical protein
MSTNSYAQVSQRKKRSRFILPKNSTSEMARGGKIMKAESAAAVSEIPIPAVEQEAALT